MSNAWNITDAEYKRALRVLRNKDTSQAEWDACYHLCRFYCGQTFHRDLAATGARLVRSDSLAEHR